MHTHRGRGGGLGRERARWAYEFESDNDSGEKSTHRRMVARTRNAKCADVMHQRARAVVRFHPILTLFVERVFSAYLECRLRFVGVQSAMPIHLFVHGEENVPGIPFCACEIS
eukprot:1069458-Pleurochrysis_carterae.AAC.1